MRNLISKLVQVSFVLRLVQACIICTRLRSKIENSLTGHVLRMQKGPYPTAFYALCLNRPLSSTKADLPRVPYSTNVFYGSTSCLGVHTKS